jgi:hypothetical protein
VDGPAHITNVQDSVLVIKCRQFRMHECHNADVYLTCSSRPIIEDCSGIRFAKLPQTYVSHIPWRPLTQRADHGPQAHVDRDPASQDMWDQIDDFKWLKAEQSPNWSLLPPDEIVLEDVWRDIVPGGPGWSLEDILKATKVLT